MIRRKPPLGFWLTLGFLAYILSNWSWEFAQYREATARQSVLDAYDPRDTLDPRSMSVTDGVAGEQIYMFMDREISMEFVADWSSRIRKFPSQEVFCEANGGGPYTPEASLPDPLTLDWWHFGNPDCQSAAMTPGAYTMTTCWSWTPEDLPELGIQDVCVSSPPFNVFPEDLAQGILELKQEIQEIQASE